MKIVTLSDIHGLFPDKLPNGDVLVIAGDICPADNHKIPHQAWWLKNIFNCWLKAQDFNDIVLIAGNHDWVFQDAPHMVTDLACHYLQESSVTLQGVKFYGLPHTPNFCNWAFMPDSDGLQGVIDKIPNDTDVLVTHGPANGILDVVKENYWDSYNPNAHLGCNILRHKIDNMPKLKLHVFGHIHSGHGMEINNNLISVNASYVNERYQPDYDRVVVDI